MTRFGLLGLLLAVVATPAAALPLVPSAALEATGPGLRIEVATAPRNSAAYRICKRQYGARLAFVTTKGNRYTCHFRKSTKQLSKEASRSCRKSGMRLVKITSIKIKGSRVTTRFQCRR
jgi:hypothetical protein